MVATDPTFAALELNGFNGDVTLINANIGTNMTIAGESKQTNLFAMLHGQENYFTNKSASAHVVLFGSTKYTLGGGAIPILIRACLIATSF